MFGFGGGGRAPAKFEECYHCYSLACADKAHAEAGDKIILPPSALDTLSRMMIEYPMLFKLTSESGNKTHCGVLEFSAPEGSAYIPFWMMQNLLIAEGSLLTVSNVSLPKASFMKLKPQSVDFLEISNPRAVLEHAFRKFSCMTKGDMICIPYNSKNYHFEVMDCKPQDAACIIEADVNLDFDQPVGYVERDYNKEAEVSPTRHAPHTHTAHTHCAYAYTLRTLSTVLTRPHAGRQEAEIRVHAAPEPVRRRVAQHERKVQPGRERDR